MAASIILIVIVSIGLLFIYNQWQFKKAEKSYQPAGKFITVDGIKLHFITEGNGPPIVFLHGESFLAVILRKPLKWQLNKAIRH